MSTKDSKCLTNRYTKISNKIFTLGMALRTLMPQKVSRDSKLIKVTKLSVEILIRLSTSTIDIQVASLTINLCPSSTTTLASTSVKTLKDKVSLKRPGLRLTVEKVSPQIGVCKICQFLLILLINTKLPHTKFCDS